MDAIAEYKSLEVHGLSVLSINSELWYFFSKQSVALIAITCICATLFIVIIYLSIRRLVFYLAWQSFRDGPYMLGYHQWRPAKLAGPYWCNICESIMYGIRSYVVTCDICGMFAHAQCAVSIIKCRTTSANLMSGCSSEPDALESKRITLMDTTELEDMKNRGFKVDDERGVDRYTDPSNGHDKRIARCFCKVAAVKTELKGYTHQHFWVRGNTDPMDKCSICNMFCGSILTLSGMKCAWCHVRVHESCFLAQRSHHQTLRRCELGRHRKLILPPYAVILRELTQPNVTVRALSSVRDAAQFAVTKMATVRNRRSGSITSHENATRDDVLIEDHATKTEPEGTNIIAPPASTETPRSTIFASRFEFHLPSDKIPLLVLINSKSGGKLGLQILRQARKYLNPIQVYDVAHQNPMSALNDFKELPRLRILACGGDGTVGWILNCLDDVVPSRQLPVAVLPLGTGNDLARVLGWGSGLSCGDFSERLSQVESAHLSLLDRWNVRINGNKRTVMNNYLGIGVDAQVALEFHKQRERIPGLFISQFVNKLWYSQLGAKNFLVRTCAGLASKVDLICDDCDIVLPKGTEGVIFLNINSYGGGSKLWHDEFDEESGWEDSDRILDSKSKRRELKASSPNDGLLDVVAVYGTLHLGQMQVGLSKAVRLCQCKKAEIRLKDTLPLQIDGEPWLQNACILTVSFHDQAHMLGRSVPECDNVTHRVGEVLNWAENTNIISSSQRDILLAEIARHVTSSSPAEIDGENGTAGTRQEARVSNAS